MFSKLRILEIYLDDFNLLEYFYFYILRFLYPRRMRKRQDVLFRK